MRYLDGANLPNALSPLLGTLETAPSANHPRLRCTLSRPVNTTPFSGVSAGQASWPDLLLRSRSSCLSSFDRGESPGDDCQTVICPRPIPLLPRTLPVLQHEVQRKPSTASVRLSLWTEDRRIIRSQIKHLLRNTLKGKIHEPPTSLRPRPQPPTTGSIPRLLAPGRFLNTYNDHINPARKVRTLEVWRKQQIHQSPLLRVQHTHRTANTRRTRHSTKCNTIQDTPRLQCTARDLNGAVNTLLTTCNTAIQRHRARPRNRWSHRYSDLPRADIHCRPYIRLFQFQVRSSISAPDGDMKKSRECTNAVGTDAKRLTALLII